LEGSKTVMRMESADRPLWSLKLEEPSGRVDKGEAVEVGVVEDLRLEMLWFAGVLKDRDSEDADTGESGLGDEFRADSELLGEDRLMGDDKEGSGWPAKTKAKFEEADKVLELHLPPSSWRRGSSQLLRLPCSSRARWISVGKCRGLVTLEGQG